MNTFRKIVALALVNLGLAAVAQAQTSPAMPAGAPAGSAKATTVSPPSTGRGRLAPRGAVRKPRPAAAPLGTQDVAIDDSNEHRTIDCQGNTVTINGSGNRLILRGTCTKLVLNGNDNTVRWTGQPPVVSDLGSKNVTGQIN